jgi:hypothetical protein
MIKRPNPCVILALCLALLGLAGCAYLAGKQAEAGSNPIDFEALDPYSDEAEPDVLEWFEEFKQEKGIHRLNKGEYTYILVSDGEKPSGGYDLQVTTISVKGDAIQVGATLTSPPAGAMVITVITYPSALVRIPQDGRDLQLVLKK